MTETMTTNPNPPIMGEKSTAAPLSVNAQITKEPMPMNMAIKPSTLFGQEFSIPLDPFQVTSAQAVGTLIYNFEAKFPLRNLTEFRHATTPYIPRSMLLAYFSRKLKAELSVTFTCLKVPDARVSLDFVFKYGTGSDPPYDAKLLANHNVHRTFDDQQKSVDIPIPQFWASQEMQTDTININGELFQPATIPTTNMFVYIAAPYQPSMIQPDSFDIMPELHFKPTLMEGIVAKNYGDSPLPFIDVQKKPYFLQPIIP